MEVWAARCQREHYNSERICNGCGTRKSQANGVSLVVLPGDWRCSDVLCSFMNFARRISCLKCDRGRYDKRCRFEILRKKKEMKQIMAEAGMKEDNQEMRLSIQPKESQDIVRSTERPLSPMKPKEPESDQDLLDQI